MLTPLVCKYGIGFLIAIRVIIGIFSGLSFTSAYDVLSRWIPPTEVSDLLIFCLGHCVKLMLAWSTSQTLFLFIYRDHVALASLWLESTLATSWQTLLLDTSAYISDGHGFSISLEL